MPRHVRLLCMSCLLALLGGCVQVQPWERGRLAQDSMALDPTPLQTPLREHVYQSREAAPAGRLGASGAGCGCY
jgi:hypothetical protein